MQTNQSDIGTMLSNILCGEKSLIRVAENAKYSAEDVTNVLLYAATSTSNSIESAVQDLKTKYPDSKIPSADTVHNYIKSNDIAEILSTFREINSESIKTVNIDRTSQKVAIDFHDIAYYGDKNTKGVRGIKPKNGTSWGYSFLTADVVGDCKLTLDVVNLTGLNKNYATLIKGIINTINNYMIDIEVMLMDREFFNLDSIMTLDATGTKFIVPAVLNKRIKKKSLSSKLCMEGSQAS